MRGTCRARRVGSLVEPNDVFGADDLEALTLQKDFVTHHLVNHDDVPHLAVLVLSADREHFGPDGLLAGVVGVGYLDNALARFLGDIEDFGEDGGTVRAEREWKFGRLGFGCAHVAD